MKRALSLVCLALTACGAGVAPPGGATSPAIDPEPVASASAKSKVVAKPKSEDETELEIATALETPRPEPLAEPLAKLTRNVEVLSLPGLKSKVVSTHGRGPNDVWILTEDEIVHFNGTKIDERTKTPCGFRGSREGGYGTTLYRILVDHDRVFAIGGYRDPNSRIGNDATIARVSQGRWNCRAAPEDLVPEFVQSDGQRVWRLVHNMSSADCRMLSSTGACAPPIDFAWSYRQPITDAIDMGVATTALWMMGDTDGWMMTWEPNKRSVLERYNGVDWKPVAWIAPTISVSSLWGDETGRAWVTARRGHSWDGPADRVFRLDNGELKEIAVPKSFGTKIVRGTSSHDVWFVGGTGKVYQWDGDVLRQGFVPFVPDEAWSSPGGEVWMSGEGQIARTVRATDATAEARR
jgi:hypothetical protein